MSNKKRFENMRAQLTPDESTLNGLYKKIEDEKQSHKPGNKQSSKVLYYRVASAVAACVVLAVVIIVPNAIKNNTVNPASDGTTTAPVTTRPSGGEVAVIKKWEDMNIYEQYGGVEYLGTEYSVMNGECFDASVVIEKRADVTARGFDVYRQKEHKTDAEIYSVSVCDFSAAAAVKFPGDDRYFVVVCSSYKPETLGDFINAYQLDKNLTPEYLTYEVRENGYDVIYRCDVKDPAALIALIFSDTSIRNIAGDYYMYDRTELTCSFSGGLYQSGRALMLRDGYLMSNIGETAKSFKIGVGKMNEILDFIKSGAVPVEIGRYEAQGGSCDETEQSSYPESVVCETALCETTGK